MQSHYSEEYNRNIIEIYSYFGYTFHVSLNAYLINGLIRKLKV